MEGWRDGGVEGWRGRGVIERISLTFGLSHGNIHKPIILALHGEPQ
jgi:hypothetical protein